MLYDLDLFLVTVPPRQLPPTEMERQGSPPITHPPQLNPLLTGFAPQSTDLPLHPDQREQIRNRNRTKPLQGRNSLPQRFVCVVNHKTFAYKI